MYNCVTCRPSCVYYCYCCCKCCCKCCELEVVSIQSSYISPSKCRYSSPFGNLVSCSPLTFYLYSFNYFSCGNVICGTSYLCSFSCFSYRDVIYGTSAIFLVAYTIVGTIRTIVGIASRSTLPFIIFCALTSVLSYSLFIPEPNVPPFSTLFFLLKALIDVAFFLFSSVVCISSLVHLTLVGGCCGFYF